jgi:predicted methyltransferase/ribosomal protein S18 acetylase RimI-like enzyme
MRQAVDNDPRILLQTISSKTKLKEGEEAVRRILREIYRQGKIGTKQLADLTMLPVPVVAAVRRELENASLLGRAGGAFLTEKGRRFVTGPLGLAYPHRLTCPTCEARTIKSPEDFASVLEKLKEYLGERPKPLPWLDQAHGTPETALNRALLMLEKGDVEGRRILFLGDDDFTSIAVGLLGFAEQISVLDVDSRLLSKIQLIAEKEGLPITCVEHDLRNPLPQGMIHRFDVAFTDPPYTATGLTLFASRGIEALQKRQGATLYLAFAYQFPRRLWVVQRILNRMGLVVVNLIPRFNTYVGAEILANTTTLMRTQTTHNTRPLVSGRFDDKIYTGEVAETVRSYQCRCGRQIEVGAAQNLRTIEELKETGCPTCGATQGFRLVERRRVDEALGRKLRLRGFDWADFPAVLEFEREISKRSFPDAPILDEEYHRKKLEQALRGEAKGLKVGLFGDTVVGWLWLRTETDRNTKERFGYIKSIIVHPEYRHLGLGRRLMDAARAYFLRKGVQRTDLIVSARNYGALLFFEDMDFHAEHSTLRSRLQTEEASEAEGN